MTGRISIVDDNKDNLSVLESVLKAQGFDVILAENGKDALEKARLSPPDLIVSDILMPVMDGYEATRKIRQFEKENKRNAVRIVAMTANALKSDRDKCLSVGMDDYISKPFQITELIRIFST